MHEVRARIRRIDLTGSNVGRFTVVALLGEGGMGEVYRARDTKLNRTVALKRMHAASEPTERNRVLVEAERASRVNHPNIAAVYDVIEENNDVYLVMEYVEGKTLRNRMAHPLTVDEAMRIALACADALAAAHKNGVIHCDIKPENIMLTPDGTVKLLDFGVAKVVASADGATIMSRTTTAAFSGTPAYMAPEILNELVPDARADIFSLGAVLYEMIGGKNPFIGDTLIETANHVLIREPAPLRRIREEVPEALDRIVAHMLAKDRDQRYMGAAQVAHDLRAILAGRVETVLATLPPKVGQRSRWAKPLLIAAVVTLLAIAGTLMWRLRQTQRVGAGDSRVIAVLPFTVASDDRSARAFTDGLVETLSAKLSKVGSEHHLSVVPPWEIREQRVTTPEQAQKTLGASLVLQGSMRQVERNVRVTYALVDTRSRQQLRGDAVTAVMSDPFAVEDKVVDSVLGSLEIALAPDERNALNANRPGEPGAYDFYLQGRGYLADFHKPENLDNAIQVFQRALQFDPNYALAYAGLGETYWMKYEAARDPKLVQRALESCTRSVQLDRSAAEGYVCLGGVYNGTGKYEAAAQQYEQALRIDRTNDLAHGGLGTAYENLNRLNDAEATLKRAVDLRRGYWGGHNRLGVFYYNHARYKDAAEAFKKVTELTPDNFRAFSNLGGVYLATGEYGQAIDALRKSVEIRPSAPGYANLATAYFYQHRFGESSEANREALKLERNSFEFWTNLCESVWWQRRRVEDAKEACEKAVSFAEAELKVNPRNGTALSAEALARTMLGDRSGAEKAVRSAVTIAPADQDIALRAAVVYQMAGRTDDAIQWVQKAVGAGLMPNQVTDHPAFEALRNHPDFQKAVRK